MNYPEKTKDEDATSLNVNLGKSPTIVEAQDKKVESKNDSDDERSRPAKKVRKRKTKEIDVEDVQIGTAVVVKFGDKNGEAIFHAAVITKVFLGDFGEVEKVGIKYDNGDEEESPWPDKDLSLAPVVKVPLVKVPLVKEIFSCDVEGK